MPDRFGNFVRSDGDERDMVAISVNRFASRYRAQDEPTRRLILHGLIAYVVSRILTVIGAGLVAAEQVVRNRWNLEFCETNKMVAKCAAGDNPFARKVFPSGANLIAQVFGGWDGNWYLRIVSSGYPRYIPKGITYDDPPARAAFFPTYPTLVRVLDKVLPGGPTTTGVIINIFLGAAFIAVFGFMAMKLFGAAKARHAVIILCLFPGSFVLSYVYSEALLLLVAACCLWALHRERWLVAGLFAAFGTATRPNGLALVMACAVASIIAIRQKRDWGSLIAPVLAPLGFIGFMIFLRQHTGESLPWFRVQREAWREGTSFGGAAVSNTLEFLVHPLSSPTNVLTAASLVAVGVLLWSAYRHRLPLPMLAYSLGILFLMLLPATVTARPRFVFTAFPLFISAGAMFHDKDTPWWELLIVVLSAGLVTVVGMYGVISAVP